MDIATIAEHLVSPRTGAPLTPADEELVSADGGRFAVRGGIARFVANSYADSFGDQWNRYRRVQLDSATGKRLSADRLYQGTGWSPDNLDGTRVLEVGCGAGRFTEVMLAAGAEVWAIDATSAVDVCLENNGPSRRLAVIQADLFALPFARGSFDRVFCYGVLQHTPNPRAAFLRLIEYVKPGGSVAADVYALAAFVDRWSSKTLWRPLTRRMSRELLGRIVEWYVPHWLPVDTRLARIPRLGRFLTAVVPCWNYTGILDLDREELVAWAILDTFDALSPRYDYAQTLEAVQEWGRAAGLEALDVRYGGNGILINGRRPA
jgi:2-polyprenyl-3-methyl-5-hydroxy-6-metoxy-1,4-benzoquinol methylase